MWKCSLLHSTDTNSQLKLVKFSFKTGGGGGKAQKKKIVTSKKKTKKVNAKNRKRKKEIKVQANTSMQSDVLVYNSL